MLGLGRLRIAVAGAVLGASVLTANPPGQAAVCDTAPVVRATVISQGVGEYTRVVRGKESVIRVAVSRPSCSSTTTTLVPASTSLTGSLSLPGGVPLGSPFTVATPWAPVSDTAVPAWTDSLPAEPHAAWPLFVVPGSALAPTSPGDFTLNVSITLAYRVGNGPVLTRTYAGGSKPVTTSNPLSVLLVPMGNAANPGGMAAEFTTTDATVVENGMRALSRVTPTATDEGDLCEVVTPPGGTCVADTAAGIRWTLSPAMLNLGPSTATDPGLNVIPAGEKFCGTGLTGNMPHVSAGLASVLASWNARNPAGRADIVVGVVGENASYGFGNPPPSGKSCFEGFALIGGPVAWARAVGEKPASGGKPASPAMAGALLSQEFGHTLGLVPDSRDDDRDPSHSPFDTPGVAVASADLGTGTAYNTSLRLWLADDRSAMKYTNTGWGDDNVLFQPKDWSWAACALGATVDPGAPAEEVCRHRGALGAAPASGPHLRVTGRTDGTAVGTVVTESERTASGGNGLDPDSDLLFVQLVRRGTEVTDRSEQGVALWNDGAHAHDGNEAGHCDHCGTFEFSAPDAGAVEAGATRVYRLEHDGIVLAEWEDTDFNPVIGSVELAPEPAGAPVKVTDTPGVADADSYLSPDGRVLAWTQDAASPCPTVEVAALGVDGAPVASATLDVADLECPAMPSIRPDNGALAVSDRGSLWVVDMTVDDAGVAFGNARRLLTCDLVGGPFCARAGGPLQLQGRASRTAWERTAGQAVTDMALAFELNAGDGLGDIYVTHPYALADGAELDATNSTPVRIGTAYQGEPSFAPDDSALAFRQGADEIRTVPVDGLAPTLATDRLVCACGALPWWGTARHIAVGRDGNAYALDLASPGSNVGVPLVAGNRPAFTATGSSLSSWRLYFDRDGDIHRLGFAKSQLIRVTGRDCDNREDVRAGVYLDTGNGLVPWAVADQPTLDPVDPCGVHFESRFEPNFLTPSASPLGPVLKVAANLNDGVDISGVVRGGDADSPTNAPILAIAAPPATGGAAIVPLRATAKSPTWGEVQVQWFLRSPGSTAYGPVAATGNRADVGPLTTAGVWGIKAVARDRDGLESTAETFVTICGIAAHVDFDPNTLFAPSEGQPVQVHVTLPCGISPAGLSASITEVDGLAYSQPATAWNVTSATTATAKFDRATLTAFMSANGMVGRYVPVTVRACSTTGCTSGVVVTGTDPTAPFVSPS
ncbi:MAG: hypothetical protein KY443_06550 [Actinobacteria bacterium]|nr:hypothetical protein [Actinomycetota bacterium]